MFIEQLIETTMSGVATCARANFVILRSPHLLEQLIVQILFTKVFLRYLRYPGEILHFLQ